jgi:hypothetical protein
MFLSKGKRLWASLDLEERILNIAAMLSLCSFFLPWLSGEWLGGDAVSYTGFSFYTSLIGITAFLLMLVLLLITIVPLCGGPILLRKKHREWIRLCLASQTTILLLAALSVLMKVTYEFSRIEIRLGMYFSLIGSIVVTIYCFLRWQEDIHAETHDLFRHPEDTSGTSERLESTVPTPPPPPPPPPLEPEEPHYRA